MHFSPLSLYFSVVFFLLGDRIFLFRFALPLVLIRSKPSSIPTRNFFFAWKAGLHFLPPPLRATPVPTTSAVRDGPAAARPRNRRARSRWPVAGSRAPKRTRGRAAAAAKARTRVVRPDPRAPTTARPQPRPAGIPVRKSRKGITKPAFHK